MSKVIWAKTWWRFSVGVVEADDGKWTKKGRVLRYRLLNACSDKALGVSWVGTSRQYTVFFAKENT